MTTTGARLALATLAAAALLAGGKTSAQHVVQGFPRVNQSDVSGPSLTSSDLVSFAPGTVQSVGCAAAWGIRTEARSLGEALGASMLSTEDSLARRVAEGAQADVALLLAGEAGSRDAASRVAAALGGDSVQTGAARRQARQLVRRLNGLLGVIARMEPRDPGRAAPTRLYAAIRSWNEYIDASSPAFLANPPEELLAILAALSRLDNAATANAFRRGDPAAVDAYGLGCALIGPAAQVEVPFQVCVLDGGDFRLVDGVFLPATGDSLELAGRRPLGERYPDREGYAIGRPWFGREQPITFGGSEYRQWGMSRVIRPGELRPIGSYGGVPIFAEAGHLPRPDVIYVPFRSGCEVQAYQRTPAYRRVRG